ncbi:hypothetical protein B0H11DRAFT_752715 [Mycena galericulata]|nr:hypothetical protein B0H11DRAFT_752715 [Mycena galericulata]
MKIGSTRPRFHAHSSSASSSQDWIGNFISTAKVISAGANYLPFPYVGIAFGTALNLLETVEKIKQNRDDLKELCSSTVQIVSILRDALEFHGDVSGARFKGLCEEFASFLQSVSGDLEKLQADRQGFRGRFKEVIRFKSIGQKITEYKTHINELRANFTLMAAIDTNLNVAKVHDRMVENDVASRPLPPDYIQSVPLPTICASPSNIFHGRRDVLDDMHGYFSQDVGKRHMCLLYGLGGSGKTQIALKFIEESDSTSRFSDVFFIDASTVDTIHMGLKNVATARYLGETPHDALKWLSRTQSEWLLLFDNADDPSINLRNFFPRCGHGNILITSRNPQLRVHAPDANHRISDMDEDDAIHLLLRSAAQGVTEENYCLARDIVKVLFYLPLAIVQAGAFVSKSGALEKYLDLYRDNCARLLSEQPNQTQDDYARTVYTTWKISFDCLSRPAMQLLQLSSFLHHDGISERIFANAASYKFKSSGPTEDEVQEALEFLAQFLTPSGTWDSLKFMDLTNEIHGYSLIDLEPRSSMYSFHPLVHEWTRSTVPDEQSSRECMAAIAGMSIPWGVEQDDYLFRQRLLPHLDSVMRRQTSIESKFSYEYGFIYYEGGRGKEAERLTVSLLKMQKQLLGEEHPSTLTAMGNLASTYCALGSWKEAEALGAIVLERRTKLFGPDHPETLLAMGDLAWTYQHLGHLEEAKLLEITVLEKQKQLLGEDHPDTLRAMGHLALTYYDLGFVEEARSLGTLVVEGRKRVLGADHPETLRTIGNVAMLHFNQGRVQVAEQLETFVLERRKRVLGNNHPHTLRTMEDVAAVYYKQGRLKDAEELEVAVVKKRKQVFGEDHPDTLRSIASLAVTRHSQGHLEDANALNLRALEGLKRFFGEGHDNSQKSIDAVADAQKKKITAQYPRTPFRDRRQSFSKHGQ